MRLMLIAFSLLSAFAGKASDAYVHRVGLFNFDTYEFPKCDEPDDTCLSVEEMVKKALDSSMESREKIQLLFQAKENVKTKMGNILPQIDAGSVISSSIDQAFSFQTAIPFIGFLFPNRWFDWRSSQLLKNAEQESLATLLANKVQMIQRIYFDIQTQIWSIMVLKFYIGELEKVIAFLKENGSTKQSTPEDIAILENMRGILQYKLAFIDSLSSTKPRLATQMGYNPDYDWGSLSVAVYDPHFKRRPSRMEYHQFWLNAIINSSELKNVNYILQAAEKDKKSVVYNIFDPAANCTFGYAYNHRIKIARSGIKVIKIQLERTERQLSNAIQDSLNNFNDSVEALPGLEIGMSQLESMRRAMEEHLNDRSKPFDIVRTQRYFDFAEGQALRYINLYFSYRVSEADLERYTWDGKYYRLVRDYINYKLPLLLKQTKKSNSWHKN